MTTEHVVLVDSNDQEIGTVLKSEVHQAQTPLHQAFSVFIFRSDGSLILQQRAASKKTWPHVWSNTCCGHPLPKEPRASAVQRRLRFELGMETDFETYCVLPDYRYCATHLGVMENEICPVFVGFTDNPVTPNPDEVAAIQEINWEYFLQSITNPSDPTWDHLSVWCREETALLAQSAEFNNLFTTHTLNKF